MTAKFHQNLPNPLIIANWKMNCLKHQALSLVEEIKKIHYSDIILCPPYTLLDIVHSIICDTQIQLGAQDLTSFDDKFGPYTGDISAIMLKDLGCNYVIVGHSERRTLYNNNNAIIKQKVMHAHAHQLSTIICIGETEQEKLLNNTYEVLETQLSECLPSSCNNINTIIAYEPIWAIGTGKIPTIEEISLVANFINNYTAKKFEKKIKIVYGGSVNAKNFREIISARSIYGVLIGSSSLKIDEIKNIIQQINL